ncbi:F-box/LRR-repeat protein 12-like [Suncus etruscus]|uniref:F-box/LRR-repeat protein 12-like n=1 Tax=Suncus etruscus TaxID=109475 RepID=UPI00210F879C|nr:F-box/LRR-repeat protein 12-like [Suncus etruscus]
MASLDDLPDLVLLDILSLLPVRERVRNARVCRRWKRLVRDPLTWRHADLPLQEVRPKIVWRVLRRYIGSSLQSLHLQGYRVSRTTLLDMFPGFFKALSYKCPHLQRLSLHMANLFFIPMASLPRSIRQLEIHSCDISLIWMSRKEDEGALPHLEQLVLDHVPSFQDCHLHRLSCFPALRSLILAGTYRLTEEGLNKGLQELSHLQRIEVLGCAISADSALQAISSHLREVRHIRLTVKGLSGLGLVSLEGIPTLESLSLLATADSREVRTLTTQLLSSCLTLPRLRVLELQGQGWEGHEAEEEMLKKGLPHCLIIIGAAPPQTMDWWRFVSNPKNANKFLRGTLSSTRIGVRNPCVLPRIFDMSSLAYRMTPAYLARIRLPPVMLHNRPDAYRFPPAAPPAFSCHLLDVRHIQVMIKGLLARGLVSLEGIPTLECLRIFAITDTGDVFTFATQLPHLAPAEDHGLVEVNQQTPEFSQVPQDVTSTRIGVWIPRYIGEPIAHRRFWNLVTFSEAFPPPCIWKNISGSLNPVPILYFYMALVEAAVPLGNHLTRRMVYLPLILRTSLPHTMHLLEMHSYDVPLV